MNDQTQQKNRVATVAERAAELDAIATQAAQAFLSPTQNVSVALQLADGIRQMRELFDTPEIKSRILPLQDTRLGFRTDRDPKNLNRKTGRSNDPYPWEVVRECAIEALLRGVTLCGNQFNIIANGSYITKEGYLWKLSKVPGFADFKPVIGVPQTRAGGALVHCECTWTLAGKPGNLAVDIAAKGDDYTGVDGYVGKAERKFYRRVYEIVSGRVGDPDGDADDRQGLPPIPQASIPETFSPPSPTQPNADTAPVEQRRGPGRPRKVQSAPESEVPKQEQAPAEAVVGTDTPAAPPPAGDRTHGTLVEEELTPREKLSNDLTAAGYTWDHVVKWNGEMGFLKTDLGTLGGFDDLSADDAEKLWRSVGGLKRQLATVKGGAK